MSFPACKHRTIKPAATTTLRWLAAEPFRLFFFSGALWSVVGVSLWPLFYAGKLEFYPNYCHSRLMIEAFAGAFVIGFLGTAGPRMASAPKLTPVELLWLFGLHQASAVCHLRLQHAWGDALFVMLLVSLLVSLVSRVVRFGKEMPPPQMWLALTGLVCGICGAGLHLLPATWADIRLFSLAGLLLYHGLLLPPVLGIGSFIFPRMLGGEFGDPGSPREARNKSWRAITAALLIPASFFIEAFGWPVAGCALRAFTATAYLLMEVRWRRGEGPPRGSWAVGMRWALITGFIGLVLAGCFYERRIAIEHLLYIGGFGLLILAVASRVLFGHSGDLAGFEKRSWFVRVLIVLGVLAAATRMIPAFLPQLTVSHHVYAALLWAVLALLWLGWHSRRFMTRDQD